MGHHRLGTLPKTQKWERVVGLIAGGADVERIAAASADAAEHGLERASQDQGLAHAFWLLTQIPQAARQSDFADEAASVLSQTFESSVGANMIHSRDEEEATANRAPEQGSRRTRACRRRMATQTRTP